RPVLAILVLQAWGAVCTIPYLGKYGINALRDATIWGYSWFAIIVASTIIATPGVLELFVRRYRSFTGVFLSCAPVLWVAFLLFSSRLPHWPAAAVPISGVPIIDVKAGDMLVQLSGVFAFFAAGLGGSFGLIRATLLVCCVGMGGSISRGGFLAFAVSALLASVMGENRRVLGGCL